jgi:hypothetical protein
VNAASGVRSKGVDPKMDSPLAWQQQDGLAPEQRLKTRSRACLYGHHQEPPGTTQAQTWLMTTSLGHQTSGAVCAKMPRACAVPDSVAAATPAAMNVSVYAKDL